MIVEEIRPAPVGNKEEEVKTGSLERRDQSDIQVS